MTNQQNEMLISRFTALNQEMIKFVKQCPTALWQSVCPDDARTIGVVAHHIASSHEPIARLIELVAASQPVPAITGEMLDQMNAAHAVQHSACTQEEVATLLRTQGELATQIIRNLRPAQLVRTTNGELFGHIMTTQQVIENVLIGHASGHFARIQPVIND